MRTRALLVVGAMAFAGIVGVAENVAPYEVHLDEAGGQEAQLPEGTVALVDETPPGVGDVAAYHTPSDDLAADRVASIHDTSTGLHYALDHDDADRPTVVVDDQVIGRLVASASHVGVLWTLPAAVQVTLKVVLVGAYLGMGAHQAGLVPPRE